MIKFYQYRSAEITKIILKDSTLKFTNPMDFNDPFDFHPTVPDVINKFVLMGSVPAEGEMTP
jgi:hypothetical protein